MIAQIPADFDWFWPSVVRFAVDSEHGPHILSWLRRKNKLKEWRYAMEMRRWTNSRK